MTHQATEHPLWKQGVIWNLSSVSCIFHAPLKPSQIQFKCKATEERYLCLSFTVLLPQQSLSFGPYG